ncbi:hypothetical protein [Paraliomyxa miuraensis]|uniref:hypothetical protein n=1 Tax=Paraliomyxa miuraensis TaxID=376150 RepID=UPI00224F4A52|nr:hypothetical protein [Paraliomyxa miuraensis]MCX4245949.1 hypothetical protein [Paraliomyxa miuraensis]
MRTRAIGLLARLGLGMGLGLAVGCSSPLDKAQTAWAEGEGDFAVAEPYYKEAIAKGDDESEYAAEELYEIYLQLANLNKKDHPKDAEVQYRGALALQPDSVEGRTGLIRLLITLYRYEEAYNLAYEGVSSGKCPSCKPLLARMLIEGGDQRTEAEDWAGAEASYAAAMDLLPDAAVAMGLARSRTAQGKVKEAAESLEQAAGMIDQNDIEGRRRFLELRREVVMAALGAGEAMLADKVLDVAPKGVTATDQLGLAVEVSMELTKVGKADEALSRMQAFAQAAEAGRLALSDEQKGELLVRTALLFGARANQKLAAGDAAGARADIDEGLKLVAGEPTLTMQKAITFGTEGKIADARKELGALSPRTPGYRTVDAILYAMEVDKLVESGKLSQAADYVEFGKKADPENLEIHVAAAQVLMLTEWDGDMLKKEAKEMRKLGIVPFPKGKHRPVRAAEALAELSWARKGLEAQDKLFPFRDPNLPARLDATEAKVKAFFPFKVEHVAEDKAVLVINNAGNGPIELLVEGRRFFRKKKKLQPLDAIEVEMNKPGLTVFTLTVGDTETQAMFVAEPHTKVEIALPLADAKPK